MQLLVEMSYRARAKHFISIYQNKRRPCTVICLFFFPSEIHTLLYQKIFWKLYFKLMNLPEYNVILFFTWKYEYEFAIKYLFYILVQSMPTKNLDSSVEKIINIKAEKLCDWSPGWLYSTFFSNVLEVIAIVFLL